MNVGKLFGRFLHWHRDREAIQELLARSDRDLNDIGLNRASVVEAVRGKGR